MLTVAPGAVGTSSFASAEKAAASSDEDIPEVEDEVVSPKKIIDIGSPAKEEVQATKEKPGKVE